MKSNKNITLLLLKIAVVLLAVIQTAAAQNPVPAATKTKNILITNVTINDGIGGVFSNASVGIVDGKIAYLSYKNKDEKFKWDSTINAANKQIYPGIIALNTNLGLSEIEAVRSTNDFAEVGDFNPSSRALIAYNTDSKITPTVRTNGILTAQIVPQGGIVSGTSSIVNLDGWNWEDAVDLADDAVHINWPGMRVFSYEWAGTEEKQKERIESNIKKLDDFFRFSSAYCAEKKTTEKNLNYEAMREVYAGQKKIFVHCDFVKELLSAINYAKMYQINIVLVGAADAYLITDLIKESNCSIVLSRAHSLPMRDDEDINLPYKMPKILFDAGINFAMSCEGFWQTRNLPFMAGTAVAYGLSKEQALAAITSKAAKIIGADNHLGSIEIGKDATLVMSTGDLLDMETNNVEIALIKGKQIDLDNIQKQLYNKYKNKYGLK